MKKTQFVITSRILSLVSLSVDGFMIYLLRASGFWTMFIVGQILFFMICVGTLAIYEKFLEKGYDLLSMDYFHGLRDLDINLPKRRIFARITQWIVRSENLIFWFGSLWIEPDVVTLLLRKENKLTLKDVLKITLPSNFLCISFWSVIFYLGNKGYTYFQWFVE